MAEESTAEDKNILAQQGTLLLIAEELRRDMEAYQINFESLRVRWELSEDERLSLNRRMQALDRMISEVRK